MSKGFTEISRNSSLLKKMFRRPNVSLVTRSRPNEMLKTLPARNMIGQTQKPDKAAAVAAAATTKAEKSNGKNASCACLPEARCTALI